MKGEFLNENVTIYTAILNTTKSRFKKGAIISFFLINLFFELFNGYKLNLKMKIFLDFIVLFKKFYKFLYQ